MMGMLVGIGALAAWGLHRFQALTANLTFPALPFGGTGGATSLDYLARIAAYEQGVRVALHTEYGEIFRITAVVCAMAAVLALGLGAGSRRSLRSGRRPG
jgi:hypothetical protein